MRNEAQSTVFMWLCRVRGAWDWDWEGSNILHQDTALCAGRSHQLLQC